MKYESLFNSWLYPTKSHEIYLMNRWFGSQLKSSQEMLGEWTQVASTRQYCPSQNDINRPLRMAPWHSWLVERFV